MQSSDLPVGYTEIKKVDLQKDRRLALIINALALAIAAVLFFVGVTIVPLSIKVGGENAVVEILKPLGALLAIALYMVGHEIVHGMFIKKHSGQKAKYGFTGLYAFAGSDAYFNRRQYVVIALAPIVFFGLLFLLLNLVLPVEWFWGVYLLQIINLSGGAGDIYITGVLRHLPKDVLVRDAGVSMAFYSREQ